MPVLLFMAGCALLLLAGLWGLAQQCMPTPPAEQWTAQQQRHTVEAMQRAAREATKPKESQ
jgi:hypothetical protein